MGEVVLGGALEAACEKVGSRLLWQPPPQSGELLPGLLCVCVGGGDGEKRWGEGGVTCRSRLQPGPRLPSISCLLPCPLPRPYPHPCPV